MKSLLIIFLITTYVILGSAIYFLYRSNQYTSSMMTTTQMAPAPVKKTPTLPPDAVKISECIPDMGEHWVRPQDIPGGPYYVVYQGKVVAVEFMFKPEDIPGQKTAQLNFPEFEKYMKDNNYDLEDVIRLNEARYNLDGYEYQSMHVAWTAPHAGFPVPHMDIHAYLIPESEIQTICPDVGLDQVYSPEVIKTIQEKNIPFPEAPKQ